MSLRTKLLAAVVGVPILIQLVSLYLLVRFEDRVVTSKDSIGRLYNLAPRAGPSEFGRAIIEELNAGQFDQAYLMRWEREDREDEYFKDYWTVAYYFDVDRPRNTTADIGQDNILEEYRVEPTEATSALPAGIHQEVRPDDTGNELADFIYARLSNFDPTASGDGYIAIYPELETRKRRYAVLLRVVDRRIAGQIYLVMVLGALATGLIGWWLLSRLVTSPLGHLAETADAIAAGRPIARPKKKRKDEFGRTIETLHRMGDEIAEYQGHLEDRVMSALSRMKKAEKHLTIAQRLAATGTLASGLAHEINNPLGGMKNAVNALSRGDLTEEQTGLYLELVTDGLARIEQMVKKFVTFTPRRVEAQPADLVEVVEKSLALTRHKLRQRGVAVERRLPPGGHAIVYGDPNELQQVTLNLLLNAADAVEGRPDPRVEVEVTLRDEDWILKVRDNGTGIDVEDQDRIFDMFFTTKEVDEGSGMGLAIVHSIVTNHGGRIELESAPGEGTTFLVLLPSHSPSSEAAEVSAPHP